MRLITCLMGASLALLAGLAQADTVAGLYQVREPVQGQGEQARAEATGHAFDTLVQRLTGDASAAQSPALASLRKDPQPIISQFGFEGGTPESLLVEFDPGSTERALRKAGLALWGSNRPSILGWWLFETAEGSHLVGDGQPDAKALRRAAQHRGLPLRLPLGDLQEQLVADAKQLEAKQPAALREASERYGANALLAVHAQQAEGQWQAKWQLWLGDQREQGTAQGADPAALADAVMLAIGNRLAPRYVVRPGSSSSVQVRVQGMNLARYAELGRVLEAYAPRLQRVTGDTLTYAVSGNREQLRAQLALGKLQEVQNDAQPVPAVSAPVSLSNGAGGEPAPVPEPPFEGLQFRW
ncbi:DUF2066 domain-containing protein [Pseudomonas sp.]|uniref:DUF2066 domain-containing protein n=1 Tax=Pseudomonas sp. TaxID=306 RepID=UPI0028AB32C9|nr:DUF2066 domain-containing protein [Pseudomonas sp.]